MKTLSWSLLIAIIVGMLLFSPGGLLNRHDWAREHLKSPWTLDIWRFQVAPDGTLDGKGVNACFDICLKHGELKPMKCPEAHIDIHFPNAPAPEPKTDFVMPKSLHLRTVGLRGGI
jgi:hypothetical protein